MGPVLTPNRRHEVKPSVLPNVVVGAGVVGLATARSLQHHDPSRPVLILDKESGPARHQSGHNSGVIHSGLYYPPGSLKARLAVSGGKALTSYCTEHNIPFDVPGKIVVAARDEDVTPLRALCERGRANGVDVREATMAEVAEREPSVRARAALIVESTGRVDFSTVALSLTRDVIAAGGDVRYHTTVDSASVRPDGVLVQTRSGGVMARRVVMCAGLHADRLARRSGLKPPVRIIPFRGEYSELRPERAHLVRGLVYPTPDPEMPFLGVHLTRGLDDVVHIGPNAVPAFAREGYRWTDVSIPDLAEAMSYPGAWRLARRYGRQGLHEITRSLTGRALVAAVHEMLPDLRPEDVTPAGSGVRAQAVTPEGRLFDDFLFERDGPILHVLNAPSPAATACLVIGDEIARRLLAGRK